MKLKNVILLCLIILIALGFTSKDNKIGLKMEQSQAIVPVLILKESNPVLRIELIRNKPVDFCLKKIVLSLDGTTDLNDIESVSLFYADKEKNFSTENRIANPMLPARKITFKEDITVTQDTLVLWVSLKLKDEVNLSNRVQLSCKQIKTNIGKIKAVKPHFQGLRVGVALRQHNQDGVNTSRIPGLATSKNGTLMAIYDARYESSRDLQGHMDIAMNRSEDGGRTWKPMQIVLDMKKWGGLPEKYNGVSDACILVNDNTGAIYVAGLWMHGILDSQTGKWVEGLTEDSTRWIHQWVAKGSQPGFGVKETSQFLIAKSTDDGLTWSEPINITSAKKKEWWLFAPAPGQGITLKDGTLVFPTQGRDEKGMPFSNITYSRDGGKTWKTSNPARKNTTECAVAQLSDGSLMLNMRDNRNRGNTEINGRAVAVTKDLGETWTEHPTSRKALIEPTCMASLHKHTYTENGHEKSILLFSNPASKTHRNNITLKVSFDNGQTWPEENSILLDEGYGRGYSCITSVNDSTIGILYESSQADMVFQTIKIEEIIQGK